MNEALLERNLPRSKLSRTYIPPNKRYHSSSYHSHFNMENLEKDAVSKALKHLNDLDTIYDKTSVQRTNMAAPVYEQTLPRLTTDYSAPVAAYDEKHANNPHRDIPYDTQTQYRHSKVPLKAT